MVEVRFNISTRLIVFLTAIFIFIIGLNFALAALGTVPNPGHQLTEIQGYFSGDSSLDDSIKKLDDTKLEGASLSCTSKSSYTKGIQSLCCDSGFLTGAGGAEGNLRIYRPTSTCARFENVGSTRQKWIICCEVSTS